MWTEAHRARHEPGLKGLVAACVVDEIAAWLGRADPPRSGRATPTRRVVGAVAWHLRVGGPWRALPAGWLPWRRGAGHAAVPGAGSVALQLRLHEHELSTPAASLSDGLVRPSPE